MFGVYGEGGFIENWVNFIIFAILIFIGIWLFFAFLSTKIGKKAENKFYNIVFPFSKWYRNLPDGIRKVVGVLSLALYCVGCVVLLIYISEG